MNPGGPKTVALDGPVTIYEVAGLREAFREALAEGVDLQVELDESTKWDLAGLQLLISCVQTAKADGRSLVLAKIPRSCVEVAERAGLSDWLESASQKD
ncbi:lipid asymmetry maintenance protein MlaB [Planctomyces sp. SH-PL62]|uniref:STAS domain-containing protein n=1 Tax=Planctomyces sp. SH-PL62 TaxID=1636152 RepID=UPI002101156F|nr:STAS domain-containing protein [Planctomyces sp. SH-PL62]